MKCFLILGRLWQTLIFFRAQSHIRAISGNLGGNLFRTFRPASSVLSSTFAAFSSTYAVLTYIATSSFQSNQHLGVCEPIKVYRDENSIMKISLTHSLTKKNTGFENHCKSKNRFRNINWNSICIVILTSIRRHNWRDFFIESQDTSKSRSSRIYGTWEATQLSDKLNITKMHRTWNYFFELS